MPVILWDIDGTLVRTNGGRVSVNAFVRALQAAAAAHASELAYPHDSGGKTDKQIALEMLTGAAIPQAAAEAILVAFATGYLAELERERSGLTADLCVLPGVREALSRLQELQMPQTLLTGNLEPVARLKLACAELDQYVDFELGAFGSDHHDRNSLVPIVRERVRRRLGHEAADFVVVGDTPRDIACARAGGARVVAVATGRFSRNDLEAHAPDAVFDDLSDTDAVIATLLRYSYETSHRFARPNVPPSRKNVETKPVGE